jgi:5-formyltetrahydrofolate cyclo-ligase
MRPDSRFHFDAGAFIPDFEGSEKAARFLMKLTAYRGAQTILVTPDNCLEDFRHLALTQDKTLVVPTFGLRRGFIVLDPTVLDTTDFKWAATLDGMERAGQAVKPSNLRELGRIDLLVTGAVAVTTDGTHIGGGQAFLDLEWAALRELALTAADTTVVAVAHDLQVLDEHIQRGQHQCHISTICTPTRTLQCPPADQPPGILWDRLGLNYGADNPSLRELLDFLRSETRT